MGGRKMSIGSSPDLGPYGAPGISVTSWLLNPLEMTGI
jgi:hypothetical protein